MARLFERVQAVALPTIVSFPPTLERPHDVDLTRATLPVNLGGNPALALPVPAGVLPSSLQLVGPEGSEELLCATGLVLEGAAATAR